jgi:hypothetical protein
MSSSLTLMIDDHLNIIIPQYGLIIIKNYTPFTLGSLDNIFDTTGRMPARDFSFSMNGMKYRTASDENWKDEIKLLGKDHIFDTIYGYLANIKSIGEWTLDEFKLMQDEYMNDREKNIIKIKLYFTKYKEK